MKRIIFTLLTLIFTFNHCFSQDIITLRTNEDIKAKISEVTVDDIKYKKFDNQNGPTFTVPKASVKLIRYENGTKDTFKEEIVSNVVYTTNSSSGNDLYVQGQIDASRYYTGYSGAGTGTLLTSLLSPIVGLIPAIACSSTPPQIDNLRYPNADLMKRSDYFNGYTQRAKKIKQGKVWKNWGIAFGVNIIAVILMSN
jgi:hypothetical protein